MTNERVMQRTATGSIRFVISSTRWARQAPVALVSLVLAFSAMAAEGEYLAYSVKEVDKQPLPENLDSIEAQHLVNVEWSPYAGKRTRIGVLLVDNKSAAGTVTVNSEGETSTVSLGGEVPVNGIEAIVMDTMARTGRFALVERSILREVLGEQDLGDRVAQPSAAQTGKVLGAAYLLQVVITDYEEGTNTAGGGAIGALRKVPLIGGIGLKKKEGRIGLNFRLIDTQTSEVVYTKQVESVVKETGLILAVGGRGGSVDIGGFFGKFSKTPVGQAVIAGVNKGVFDLVCTIGSKPPKGSIVKVEGDRVWLNLGDGVVNVGDRLELLIKGEELIDPETGISLGSEDTVAGQATVAEVREKFSIAQTAGLSAAVNRGDIVTSLEPPRTLKFAASWTPPEKPKRRK